MSSIIGLLAALGSAFGWAIATILIKVGMRSKSPVSVNIVRLYVVSIMYLLFLVPSDKLREIFSSDPRLLLIAFVSAQFGFVIGDYFYFNALNRMGVSKTVPITSTYPLWAVLWASIFLGRQVGVEIYIGALLIVLAIITVRSSNNSGHSDTVGFVFAILAPLSWSIAITLMDWLTGYFDPLTLSGIRMFFAALGVSLFLPSRYRELRELTPRELIVLSGAAFFGLFLGQYLFVYSTSVVGSEISAPVSAINPIITSFLAVVILKEPYNRRLLLGLILAVLGILLVSGGLHFHNSFNLSNIFSSW